MKILQLSFVLASLSVCSVAAADDAGPKVVAFNASVRVEVDAAGRPVKVEAPADLPQVIRTFIEKRVAAWQYEPAKQGGVAVAATTYVKVGACAIPTPAGDAFRLGLDFKGNGPGIANQYARLMPPAYPKDAMVRGSTGAFAVVLEVASDGSVEASSIALLEGGARVLREFEPTLRKWAKDQRYHPEMVAGQAVATQVRVPVIFTLSGSGSPEGWKREIREQALATSECQLAKNQAPDLDPVALNSPVKITPTPAG